MEAGGTKSKSDLARERLVPLSEGERPAVVTICAAIAAAAALANVAAAIVLIADGESKAAAPAAFATIMVIVAVGLWRLRYVAVVGFQAILAVVLALTSLRLVLADSLGTALIDLAIVAVAGALFWLMVKAMARIQMPEQRRR
ncbi:MAG: hypothetical protein WDZ37_02185 [Solirubrobacterales bacterium]